MNHNYKEYLVHIIHKGAVHTRPVAPAQIENFIATGHLHIVSPTCTVITKESHTELCNIARDAVAELENHRTSNPDISDKMTLVSKKKLMSLLADSHAWKAIKKESKPYKKHKPKKGKK